MPRRVGDRCSCMTHHAVPDQRGIRPCRSDASLMKWRPVCTGSVGDERDKEPGMASNMRVACRVASALRLGLQDRSEEQLPYQRDCQKWSQLNSPLTLIGRNDPQFGCSGPLSLIPGSHRRAPHSCHRAPNAPMWRLSVQPFHLELSSPTIWDVLPPQYTP